MDSEKMIFNFHISFDLKIKRSYSMVQADERFLMILIKYRNLNSVIERVSFLRIAIASKLSVDRRRINWIFVSYPDIWLIIHLYH